MSFSEGLLTSIQEYLADCCFSDEDSTRALILALIRSKYIRQFELASLTEDNFFSAKLFHWLNGRPDLAVARRYFESLQLIAEGRYVMDVRVASLIAWSRRRPPDEEFLGYIVGF